MSHARWQVARVRHPFTDRAATKGRPALVLSDGAAFNTQTCGEFSGDDVRRAAQ